MLFGFFFSQCPKTFHSLAGGGNARGHQTPSLANLNSGGTEDEGPLCPIPLAVQQQHCSRRIFPLSHPQDKTKQRHGEGSGDAWLQTHPKARISPPRPMCSPFPGQLQGGTSLACLARPSALAQVASGGLARGGLGSLPLTGRPSSSFACHTPALPALPPRSAGCQPPPRVWRGKGGWERDGSRAGDGSSMQSQGGP